MIHRLEILLYGTGRGVTLPDAARNSSPKWHHWLWSSPCLTSSGYRGFVPRG